MNINGKNITETYIKKQKLIEEAVLGLDLTDKETRFLEFILTMRDYDTVSKLCSIIMKAKEWRG